MHTLLERPLLALAWLAAALLLALGVRRLGRVERGGFFLSALSAFLAFQAAPATGGDPPPAEQRAEPAGSARPALPPELARGEAWVRMKDLWARLDAVAPRVEPGAPAFRPHSYSLALDLERQEAFRTELAGILGLEPGVMHLLDRAGPPRGDGTDPAVAGISLPTRVLAALTLRRIEHMGLDRTMMMRMAPPPSLRFRGAVIDRLEHRIDALAALRAKGGVEEDEVRDALAAIQDDAWLDALLAVFEDWRLGYFAARSAPGSEALTEPEAGPEQAWFDPEAWIRGFDEVCAGGRGGPTEPQQAASGSGRDAAALAGACREIRAHLERLREVRGDLDALIRDLETR